MTLLVEFIRSTLLLTILSTSQDQKYLNPNKSKTFHLFSFKTPSPVHTTHSQPIASLQMTKIKPKFCFKTNPDVFFRALRPIFGIHVRQSRHAFILRPIRFCNVSQKRIPLKVESDTNSDRIMSDSIPTRHEGPSGRIRFLSL